MNYNRYAGVVVHHPFIIVTTVAVIAITFTVLPFTLRSSTFPKFQDPQMGFSTRGTVISNRITTFTNLLKEIRPSGNFTENPKEYLEIRNNNLTTRNPIKTTKRKKNNGKKEPIYGNVYTNPTDDKNSTIEDEHKWTLLKKLIPGPGHFDAKFPKNLFCGNPDAKYTHLVVTREDNADLFTTSNMRAMCQLEQELIGLSSFKKLCIHNSGISERTCCKPWSLPNYIANLNGRSSCLAITESDVVSTKNTLIKCAQHFHDNELNIDCLKAPPYCGVPLECIRYGAVFNILYFLTSTSFLPPNNTKETTALTEAMIFLPMACSFAVLPYYHELEKNTQEVDGIKVVAIDFGIKNTLFDEYLLRDTWLIGTATLFIVLCIWLYTQSIFITISTLLVVFFSLSISYTVYVFLLGIIFFPFMNLLAAIVAIGIGSDDAFIFCKMWLMQMDNPDATLLEKMTITFQHAFTSMLVTALTTSVAFLGSYISSVTAISCFSVYAGTAVIVNYLLMMTLFPACLVIWQSTFLSNIRWCWCRPQWNRPTTWFPCSSIQRIWRAKDEFLADLIIKLKYFWFILLISIALVSAAIVFIHPKLELPNTSEFQLFASSHPFEQYDFYYKNHFWFHKSAKGDEQVPYNLPLRFIWGVLPIDNGDYLNPEDLGTLTLDPSFDMANEESQTWLKDFCEKFREQHFYHPTMGPLLSNCFIETFAKSMKRPCYDAIENRDRKPCCNISKFPFTKAVFDECIIEEMAEIYNTPPDLLNSAIAGPKFSKDQTPTIKAVIVEYDSIYSYTMTYNQMHEFYTSAEAWMKEELKTAPETMKNGFFISDLDFYDLQRELSQNTQTAMFTSMALAWVVLFLSTLNFITSFFAVLTIASSISVTMAMLVLSGWKLNILESIAISTAIGLTIDFSLHYAVNYKIYAQRMAVSREAATRYALTSMAGPTLMVALTTVAAGAFMTPSLILPYIQIGCFLILIMCVSWFYSTFLLGSMLAIAGPERMFGQFRYSTLMSLFRFRRGRERPQMQLTGNLPEGHELVSLTRTRRDRPTPRPTRRSKSPGGARDTLNQDAFSDLP